MTQVSRYPEIHGFHPDWWHHHGIKMRLVEHIPHRRVVIRGSAAEIIVGPPWKRHNSEREWFVAWTVIQTIKLEEVHGQRLFLDEWLAAAFGLADDAGQFQANGILDRYGGTTGVQGKFIRWHRFLNIPGPGANHDGDPNVSLELDGKIVAAIADLLGVPYQPSPTAFLDAFDTRLASDSDPSIPL